MLVETAVLCLALNVYHEARGETLPGQYAVAIVTFNRAKKQESKVCAQVFKPKQFSWTIGKVSKVKGGWKVANSMKPRDAKAWLVALDVARHTLKGDLPDFTGGATHYHTKAVSPHWAKKAKPVTTIGQHVFYAAI